MCNWHGKYGIRVGYIRRNHSERCKFDGFCGSTLQALWFSIQSLLSRIYLFSLLFDLQIEYKKSFLIDEVSVVVMSHILHFEDGLFSHFIIHTLFIRFDIESSHEPRCFISALNRNPKVNIIFWFFDQQHCVGKTHNFCFLDFRRNISSKSKVQWYAVTSSISFIQPFVASFKI